jgi:pre-mRNA-splicing factor SYF1
VDFLLKDDGNDVDLRLARLEYHMERRPELVSSVMLRQNPHNVHEWLKRVKLFEGKPTKQILTFTEAVKTVDIAQAVGKPHALWVAFASFYEKHGDVPNARVIYEKAVQVRVGHPPRGIHSRHESSPFLARFCRASLWPESHEKAATRVS